MAETDTFDYLFKVLVLGDCGVGKSSLLFRFTHDSFSEDYTPTVGMGFIVLQRFRCINIDDKIVKLRMWDTSGQENFRTFIRGFFRSGHGVLLLYDVTMRSSTNNRYVLMFYMQNSFESIENWAKDMDVICNSGPSIILVGNGSDKEDERIIKYKQGKQLAEKLGVPFLEMSSKLSTNVDQAFIALVVDMKKKHDADSLLLTEERTIGESPSSDVTKDPCCVFCNFL